MPSTKTAGFGFEFNFTDLHTVSGLHVDETRYHEEPSAADATRILADYVHITVTQPVFFSQPSRCFSTEKNCNIPLPKITITFSLKTARIVLKSK